MSYLRAASIFMLFTCVSHVSWFAYLYPQMHLKQKGLIPANDTERQLLWLMNEYDRALGFSEVSMMNLLDGLNLCYGLLFLWLGTLNLFLARWLRDHQLICNISLLNAIALGVGFVISLRYFFWLPTLSFAVSAVLFLLQVRQSKLQLR